MKIHWDSSLKKKSVTAIVLEQSVWHPNGRTHAHTHPHTHARTHTQTACHNLPFRASARREIKRYDKTCIPCSVLYFYAVHWHSWCPEQCSCTVFSSEVYLDIGIIQRITPILTWLESNLYFSKGSKPCKKPAEKQVPVEVFAMK